MMLTAAAHAAQGSGSFWGGASVLLIGSIVLVYLLFIGGALFDVFRSDKGLGAKLAWFLLVACVPLFGPLLWFLVGWKPRLGHHAARAGLPAGVESQ
ncbi:PLD nuclease N-terminal domain-containing protein [Saccharopolyspora elongata]|uniref:PLDc_N domain-containing protein n=1 Tax=Saccharopolyspora elongata TaxID=2530387 RepID=A0A4R4YCT7_9PSEU|nr:PLD nuclease N-terminal domain-containing protein [Saccharopolyspora elongata]TDD42383.1 PLDc_N domain-containing protein [Saccharopolyspora elongata]